MHVIGLDDLRGCLASAPPLDLVGMRLLTERPHLLFEAEPLPRDRLVAAVTEIVAYTDRCAKAAEQLASVGSVPLTIATILEFGI